ncbi:MAG TPA: DUF2330 domain-containing protein [Leptospiraceae bacterium]|nr:DUF2330 domain-containing protein [Leptospirales bacterium]HMU84758.1 DUF2330 domain-containing protein [Leptospiraceae bacterium]HMW59382.1 DUF2330 domain-containing protein [Leptospiraceae bacterium]HMX56369.1 DUF2330 domain-containing protein [Leptospiraceae bacterium]HMY44460.1 DUF2330 domain-containing protein [Leptospiraceae bacterium]
MKFSSAVKYSTVALAIVTSVEVVYAFCGFYVAKADTKLFNQASSVVLVRDGDRTVLTMSNDFQGDPKEFALVVPVPTFLERGQINVGDPAVIAHVDAFTSPRLVEYFDSDPCMVEYERDDVRRAEVPSANTQGPGRHNDLGVKVEAKYTVGEYDILILSAKESGGLETWLKQNGYKIPPGASEVLGSYIKQNMRFFVAKVNLKEKAKTGFTYLRPLQIAFESPKFMLPIRLGTVNANGPQELFVFAITKQGRIETTNYRTVRLPTDINVPEYVKSEFADFYKSMFAEMVRKEDMRAVFLEHAWDMSWCDPCAADPLSPAELKKLGVFWVKESEGGAVPAFVTRLHVRYDRAHFPEDLVFQQTGDKANFQARYIMQHPFKGATSCPAGERYKSQLVVRQNQEAENLAKLTGWDIEAIRKKIGIMKATERKWWQNLWD